MTYNKPAVVLLGSAVAVIKGTQHNPKVPGPNDSTKTTTSGAYEVDE